MLCDDLEGRDELGWEGGSRGRGYTYVCVHAQSCLAVYDTMDCNPPGASVLGILQARILGWVATPSSRGSSQPRD